MKLMSKSLHTVFNLAIFLNIILLITGLFAYFLTLQRIINEMPNEKIETHTQWFSIEVLWKGTGGGYIYGVRFLNTPSILLIVTILANIAIWIAGLVVASKSTKVESDN